MYIYTPTDFSEDLKGGYMVIYGVSIFGWFVGLCGIIGIIAVVCSAIQEYRHRGEWSYYDFNHP